MQTRIRIGIMHQNSRICSC